MRNPLTIRVEAHLAIGFIFCLALFYGIIIFKTVKNFEAELVRLEEERTELNFDR